MKIPIWALFLPPLAILYGLLVIKRPMCGLFVVICVFFVPLRFGAVTLLQLIGVFTCSLVLIRFLIQKRKLILGNIFLPIFFLGILIVVSLTFTQDTAITFSMLRKWGFNFVFYMMLTNLVTRFRDLKLAVWAVLLVASVNALAGIYFFLTASGSSFRTSGLVENANEFGTLAALAVPLALYHFIYRKDPGRWFHFLLCFVLFGGVVTSVSRGALISLVVVFVFIAIVERRRMLPISLVLICAIALGPFLPSYFYKRIETLDSGIAGTVVLRNESELTVRGHYNKGLIKIWLAHPMLGIGIGNFGHYFVEEEFNTGQRASKKVAAHNLYLQTLAEMGVVGFVMLIWLLTVTMRNAVKAWQRSRDNPERLIYYGGLMMMALTVLIASISGGSILWEDFWLVISLTAVSRQVIEGDAIDEAITIT
ncbi:MAG: O-antigen ligase family protein [Acidobacteriota bacterium]|nr:O-antigen ligase family protein [Acidobacteriota bacterium]